MTRLDLDAGEALCAAMTPGEWIGHDDEPRALVCSDNPDMSLLGLDKDGTAIVWRVEDAAGLAWLATHRDALIRLARVGQAAEEPTYPPGGWSVIPCRRFGELAVAIEDTHPSKDGCTYVTPDEARQLARAILNAARAYERRTETKP